MDLKKQTFAELGAVTRADCVLASNTSTLDIDEFAQASGRPSQVIGHHFFSPANVMKLLEIVRGRETSPSVIATSVKLGKRLGKVPVVVGNCFGFVANRMLAYYMREAYLLLEEGASVAADRSRADGLRPAGRAVRHAGHRRHRRRRADPPVPRVDRQDARRGSAVRSSGSAVRDGPLRPEDRRRLVPIRSRAAATRDSRSADRRARRRSRGASAASRGGTIDDDEILARVTTALANEGRASAARTASRCAPATSTSSTATASASRAIAADRCSTPTPIGLPTVLSRVQEYRARFGDYWEPAPLLEKLVAGRVQRGL